MKKLFLTLVIACTSFSFGSAHEDISCEEIKTDSNLNTCIEAPILRSIATKYECQACGWIYDPAYGDPEQGIPRNTPFIDLPSDYICPLSGTPKEDFYALPN